MRNLIINSILVFCLFTCTPPASSGDNSGSALASLLLGFGGVSTSPISDETTSVTNFDVQTAPIPGSSGTLTFQNVSATSLSLVWTQGTDAQTPTTSLLYLAYISTSANISSVSQMESNGLALGSYATAISTINFTGLSPSTRYYFNVIIKDGSGNKVAYSMANQLTTATPDTTAPIVGGGGTLSVSGISSSSMTLSWTEGVDNITSQSTLEYLVFRSNSSNIGNVASMEANGTAIGSYSSAISSLNITGLSASTTYYFNVMIRDTAGNKSSYTTRSQATTAAPDLTSPVAGGSGTLTTSNITATSLTLNWTQATDNVTAQNALSYLVYQSNSSNLSSVSSIETNGTAIGSYAAGIVTKNATALLPSTTYYYNVIVKDAAGNKSAYTMKSQTTLADSASPNVGNSGTLLVSNVTASGLTLSWTAGSDAITAQGSLQYLAYFSTSNNLSSVSNAETNGSAVGSYSAGITSVNVTGLTDSTTYYFNLVIRDEAGNKNIYNTISQITSPPPDTSIPTVTIRNLINKSTVETGFLYGTATDNVSVSKVEVSIDSGSYTLATGTTSWKFQLPSGSNSWKEGSSHTISVRSEDASSNQSIIKTINVKKGINRDINGDGYSDLVIGSGLHTSDTGRVYIFHSTGGSGITATNVSSATTTITGQAVVNRFGYSISMGDINGDGYSDIAVGAYRTSSYTGQIYIFYSSGTSGITVTGASSADKIISGEATNNNFGYSIFISDLNSDGYSDVVVGARNHSSSAGRVYIFNSAGSSGVTISSYSSASITISGESGSGMFGYALTSGDINGDGYIDLVVSANERNSNTGSVYVFHASGLSGITTTSAASASTIITGESTLNWFGDAVSVGDINIDGYADLVVGASGYNSNTGRVYIFHSSGSSGITITQASSASRTITGEATSDKFGFALICQDLNGNGYADILAGAHGYSSGKGRAYVFHSSGASGIPLTTASSADRFKIGESASDRFGYSVGALDLTGDGTVDLVLGAAGYSSNLGRIYIHHWNSFMPGDETADTSSAIITAQSTDTMFYHINIAR
ncbi:hypothetical protein EHQ58_09110 [Leptospira ognonensis]|uniref:Fibronectin type-III domain-containing protein n=1 Tax=Leptospira ognonensis TaxID=2484945 RepID=A0A4V3JR86_9LEPT|nr:FG-GAP-like repeat-containing protein [Leptospira ognonensis]TGL59065.1 hypothetical protein EHQ58_09110 [Leptospira ognonensis]